MKDNRYNIILKARQLGISTLSAGYSLWLMLFHNDQNVLVIATGKDTAKNLMKIIPTQNVGIENPRIDPAIIVLLALLLGL